MINENDRKYIEDLIAYTEKTRRLLSNKEKSKRERKVCAAFLRCLGIQFLSKDIESSQDDPPDVKFKEACFEVMELLDKDRKRGDEYKKRLELLKGAQNIEDILVPYESPTPISYKKIFEIVTTVLSKKANHYGKQGCSSLDALIYISLENRFLQPTTSIPIVDSLVTQGWRSVSFVFPPYSHVVFAQNTAPSFLKSSKGQTKNEWDDLDSVFELH